MERHHPAPLLPACGTLAFLTFLPWKNVRHLKYIFQEMNHDDVLMKSSPLPLHKQAAFESHFLLRPFRLQFDQAPWDLVAMIASRLPEYPCSLSCPELEHLHLTVAPQKRLLAFPKYYDFYQISTLPRYGRHVGAIHVRPSEYRRAVDLFSWI